MKKRLASMVVCTGLLSTPQCTNDSKAVMMHDMQGDYQSEIIKKTRNDVLFTIDDGPGKYTSKIAKTLDSLEYEGIFFVIGKEITEKNKYMLIEAAKM